MRDLAHGLNSVKELSLDAVLALFERSQKAPQVFSEEVPGALCFFEASSRTKLSFERAGQVLGVDWLDFEADRSSHKKGESPRESLRLLKAYGAEFLVVRHSETGFAHWARQWTGLPIFNAGDGAHEHPSQALGDALCLWEHFGRRALKIAFFGDVARSRVARSNVFLLRMLGHQVFVTDDLSAETHLFSEAFSIPLLKRARLPEMDVVYALRTQKERGGESTLGPLQTTDLGLETFVMHAGPVVEGEDLAFELCHFEQERNFVHAQVRSCLRMRISLLEAWKETLGRSR